MSKNQTARQYNDLYDEIKKVDIHSLSVGMHTTNAEIITALNYWSNRRLTCIRDTDKDVAIQISAEIMRLESLLLAKTQLTMDFFRIEEIGAVIAEAESINTDRSFPNSKLPGATVDAGRESESPFIERSNKKHWGYKTIEHMVKDHIGSHKTNATIKSEIGNMVINHIVDFGDGKELEITSEEVFEKYFTENLASLLPIEKEAKIISMTPDRIKLSDLADKCRALLAESKEQEALELATKYLSSANYIPNKKKQKAEKYHDARIKSWLDDIKKTVKKVEKTETTNPIPAASETAQPAAIITKEADSVQQNKEPENKIMYMSVSIEDVDKLLEYFKSKNVDPVDIWGEELTPKIIDPELRKEWGSVLMDFKDPEKIIAELKAVGIDAIMVEDEETELNPQLFLNEANTLQEEIQHIENLIKICKEYRGGDEGKVQNEDKIEEVVSMFYATRPANEYKNKKEFLSIIKNRPKIMTTAKEFFSMMCYEKLTTYTEGKETNLYMKIYEEVLAECKKEDFEEVYVPQLVAKLKNKILMGNTSDGKQVINKNYFYTTYHVLHFIDQIVESYKTEHQGEAAATATPAVAENASIIPEDTASKKQTSQEKLDECLYLIVKNGGIIEDALKHPTLLSLKGEEFMDVNETGKVKLSDKNFDKFITDCFNKVSQLYINSMTSYPDGEMMRLVSMAHSLKTPAAQFVKDNIHLLQRGDKYLPLVGKVDDVEVNIEIASEKDFLKYVEKAYGILDKLVENESIDNPPAGVYELSTVTSYKNLEETLVKKVTEEKVTLSDLKEWAKKEVLGKLFENENRSEPMFPEKRPEVLDTYIDAFTRKLYETPESLALTNKKVQDYIDSEISKTTLGMMSFVNMIRKWCINEKIDVNLKEIRERSVASSEKNNKAMYDKYMADLKALEINRKARTFDEKPVVDTTNKADTGSGDKKVIVETESGTDVASITKKLNQIKSQKDLETAIAVYKPDQKINLIKALKTIVCDKKLIPDMKLSEAQLNEWITTYYKNHTKVEEASATDVVTEQIDFIPDMAEKSEELKSLSAAADKSSFKEALNSIIKKFNDSSDTRNAIINAITSGKGIHTMKVAKQNVTEHHKMIKKAYENYADISKTE